MKWVPNDTNLDRGGGHVSQTLKIAEVGEEAGVKGKCKRLQKIHDLSDL